MTRHESSGDTIPNCLGELGEIRGAGRTGIAADGHPAGTPGATDVERLLPRENARRKEGQALRGSFVAEDVFHGFIAVAL